VVVVLVSAKECRRKDEEEPTAAVDSTGISSYDWRESPVERSEMLSSSSTRFPELIGAGEIAGKSIVNGVSLKLEEGASLGDGDEVLMTCNASCTKDNEKTNQCQKFLKDLLASFPSRETRDVPMETLPYRQDTKEEKS
jgi:hypothetical protein